LGTIENVWWGRPYIKELLGSLKFKLEMSTFFQVNPYQTPNLYNEVLGHIPDDSRVLDLYSGVGSISLWLASKAKEVVGIEENKVSISAARTASSLNQIKNVRFVAGDVTELLPDYTRSGFECAVIDPPRKGIDKKSVDSIMGSTLKRLVYVSCNPQTLARDVALMQKKYRLVSLTGVDMFPHTDHIEAVGVLERM
jgi:23S rRNA (uracil-5-)-methyltransferase RumA